VYSVVSGLGAGRLPEVGFLRRLAAITVPRPQDLRRLRDSGVSHSHLVRAGIDATLFTSQPAPPCEPFVLMSGSAPWTIDQFGTKGVDSLLEVTQELPFLRLVLLWRGWHLGELRRRIAARGLGDRVEVLRERVDVNEVRGRVHAAVVLASDARLVKAFPHSLLEALACGRPVIVSHGIALSEYVEQTGCGRVVRGVEPVGLARAIRDLKQEYAMFRAKALSVDRRDFSIERLAEDYRGLYASILGPRPSGPEA